MTRLTHKPLSVFMRKRAQKVARAHARSHSEPASAAHERSRAMDCNSILGRVIALLMSAGIRRHEATYLHWFAPAGKPEFEATLTPAKPEPWMYGPALWVGPVYRITREQPTKDPHD